MGFVSVGGFCAVTSDGGGYPVRGLDKGVPEWRVDPEAGRALEGEEVGLAMRYGRPMHLGEGGLPVVEFQDGVVRELTPVEVEYRSLAPFEDAGYGGIVWGPGPRGGGCGGRTGGEWNN